MSIAIHYSAVRAPQDTPTPYGIQIAIEDWIRSYFRFGRTRDFAFLVQTLAAEDEIRAIAQEENIDDARLLFLDSRLPGNLAPFSLVFRGDIQPFDLLWQRELVSPGFAFCSFAHALAGRDVGEVLARYVWGPSAPGDMIVCPSRAIRSVVARFFDIMDETVTRRFGGHFRAPIDLPVIPLGVDAPRMERRAGPAQRKAARALLGLADDDVALLWVGRMSAAIKAHPIALFRAAEAAAARTAKRVVLLMQGYFVPEEAEKDFRLLAALVCPNVNVLFIPANDPRFPDGLWAAGDIFVSLIDNVQESFGLTPIEAIAAGLPRVISDWDGYRDSAEDGVDAFLIPTLQPPPDMGRAVAEQAMAERESYGALLGKAALCVAHDHEAATEAFVKLIESPDLRRKMAAAAKKRLARYDWKNIILATEESWAENIEKRRRAKIDPAPWPAVPPEMPDPFTLYASYPTAALAPSQRFALRADRAHIRALWGNPLNLLGADLMLAPDDLTTLISYFHGRPALSWADIAAAFPSMDPPRLVRSLLWLTKLVILDLKKSE
jgi:glycosyltransferase involved in cell wall biosynthesis